MGMMIEETLEFENDRLYRLFPLPQYGEGVYKSDLIMTKEIFIECYKRWIKEADNATN